MKRYSLRTFLLIAMVGTFVGSASLLIGRIDPAWNAAAVVGLSVLLVLEGMLSSIFMHQRSVRGPDRLRFRLTEIALILCAVHLADIALSGAWRQMPQSFFLPDLHGVGIVVLALLIWLEAVNSEGDFAAMDIELIPGFHFDDTYTPPARRIAGRLFTGGLVLFIVDAVAVNAGVPANRLFPALGVYFAAGLLLLARSARDSAVQQWRLEGVAIDEGALMPWLWFAGAVIIVALTVAALAPTSILSSLTESLMAVVAAILRLLSFLKLPMLPRFSYPDVLPPFPQSNLLPGRLGFPFTPSPPSGPSLNLFGPMLQWTLLLIIGVYIVRTYLRDYPAIRTWLSQLRLVEFLRQLLATLLRDLCAVRQSAQRYVPRLPVWRASAATPTSHYVQPGSRSLREQVYYYYLAALRQAADEGYPRRPPQTPYEY
ncbi:MAG TPA: hypothetical protein VMT34_06760, partial [Aggregatilineales bacterium]|nr:hypothetical protein [Aggregatilineales bacterium]